MQLEDEQYKLLAKFVEAHLSAGENRGSFIGTWPHNDPQATFFHSREQSLRFQGNMSDAEILAHAGLLLKSLGSTGTSTFSVQPRGISVFQEWRGSSSPSKTISGEPYHASYDKESTDRPLLETLKGLAMSEGSPDSRKVFVVHGRNKPARRAIFEFLRSVGLQPLEWSQALSASGKGAPFIGEVLDSAYSQVRAVVVLLTGDDLAMLATTLQEPDDPETEKQLTPQARPNVLFEAGMAFGRHPGETILVQLGTLRPFSDIGGRHVVRISNTVASRQDLANRLKVAGCSVDLSGTDWHSAGDFDGAMLVTKSTSSAPARRSPSDLHNNELAILKYLRQHEDEGGEGGFTAYEVADTLSMQVSTSKHHLDELEEQELVKVSVFLESDPEYSIARKGRALLIQMEEAGRT